VKYKNRTECACDVYQEFIDLSPRMAHPAVEHVFECDLGEFASFDLGEIAMYLALWAVYPGLKGAP
jgi:hypothetical protein